MARIYGFEPIAGKNARVLVLGSMPGVMSLTAGQYYAHPQNAFWRILGALLGFEPASPYPARVRALKDARIALWDVLHSCVREGSLDAKIDDGTLVANDFKSFFSSHAKIERVFFNGIKAEASYRRHVLPKLAEARVDHLRLPSTSPANASMAFAKKLEAWRAIVA